MKKRLLVLFVILSFFGVLYWWYFNIHTVNVDATENMVIEFLGHELEGVATVKSNDIKYNGWNQNIKDYLQSATYSFSKNNDLSNGETITVTVKFIGDKPSNLEVNHMKKTVKVEGLKPKRDIKIKEGKFTEDETVTREVEVIDGIEIPTSWELSDDEKQRYVEYIKCLQSQNIEGVTDPHDWENVPDNQCTY